MSRRQARRANNRGAQIEAGAAWPLVSLVLEALTEWQTVEVLCERCSEPVGDEVTFASTMDRSALTFTVLHLACAKALRDSDGGWQERHPIPN